MSMTTIVGRGSEHSITLSRIMQPTAQLRWLERNGEHVLQQLWVEHRGPYSEWQDVPIEYLPPEGSTT